MTLDANAKVLESLNCFYASLAKNEDFELRTNSTCRRAIADFSVQLRDFIYDTKMFSDRANTLAKITADRKSLVSLHFLYHHYSRILSQDWTASSSTQLTNTRRFSNTSRLGLQIASRN